MNWIIVIVLFAIIGFFVDREIYFYEGVHLGPRVQAWLHDRRAANYDADKRASQVNDDEMLAGPLLNALAGMSFRSQKRESSCMGKLDLLAVSHFRHCMSVSTEAQES